MLRIVILRVWILFFDLFPEVLFLLLVVLSLGYRMQRMATMTYCTLFSVICRKLFLFFASSFKVGLYNATYGHSDIFEPIIWYLSESFAVFLVADLRFGYIILRSFVVRVWTLFSAICPKFLPFFARSFNVDL